MTSLTLRLRLLIGYGYLVGLLLLATAGAMLGFLHLSESVEVVLDENFASIRASTDMLEALERQDSATLAALLEGETGVAEMTGYEAAFLDALERAEGNVTEAAEEPILAALRSGFGDYRLARRELLEARPEQPLRAYRSRVFPVFSRVKGGVLELLDVNHGAMIRADREAREAALRNGAWLGGLVAVALLSLVVLSRALQRHVLARLDELRRGTAVIAAGDLQRRLREDRDDELGLIARRVNDLLDQLQQQAGRLQGRVREERQAVLGLVRSLGPDAALYDLTGRLLAAAGDGAAERYGGGRLAQELRDWVDSEGRRRIDEAGREEAPPAELSLDGSTVRIELLRSAPGRPVAWLLRCDAG